MTTTTDRGDLPAIRVPTRPAPLGRQDSIERLLAQTNRNIVPIRKDFAQRGHASSTKPGPLHTFLRAHDDRGLEAYLFAHAMASASTPHDCVLPSGAWVRVLGLAEAATDASARAAASKVLKRLEDRKLISRGRRSRKAVVTLLREDGLGAQYERPMGRTRGDRWLQLPHAYWLEEHYRNLSLPAKTMLLIALTRPDRFSLPEERAPDWYGVSPDSAGDGLRELVDKGLLGREVEWVEEPRADSGWTQHHLYTPLGSFSTEQRKDASQSRHRGGDAVQDLDELIVEAL